MQDPFSRPTIDDLRIVIDSIGQTDCTNLRSSERLELSVPAEIKTQRGNTVSAVTREISRAGIGMLHRGSVALGKVTVRMASESRQFEYQVQLEWCTPCDNGMFMSGGKFIAGKKK